MAAVPTARGETNTGAVTGSESPEDLSGVERVRITVAMVRWQPVDDTALAPGEYHWLKTFGGLVRSDLRMVGKLRILGEQPVDRAIAEMNSTSPTNLTPVQGFRTLAELLAADWTIQGAIAHDQDVWTIRMRMMDSKGRESGTFVSDGSTNWFELSDQAVEYVLRHLEVSPSPEEQERIDTILTTPVAALESVSLAASMMDEDAFAEAAELCREALEEDPGFVLARTLLAVALYNLGQDEEALKEAREALHQDPDPYRASQLRLVTANVLATQQRLDDAAHEVAEGLRVWPENADLLLLQAALRNAAQDLDGAAASLQQAAGYQPRNPEIYANLAGLEFERGNAGAALRSLERAEALIEKQPARMTLQAEFALADAFRTGGDVSDALHHYRQFLSNAIDADLPAERLNRARKAVSDLERRSKPVPVDAERPGVYSTNELEVVLAGRLTAGELARVKNPLESTPDMARWAAAIIADEEEDLARARRLFDELASRPHAGVGSTHTAKEVFLAWADLSQPFSCQEYAKLYVALARTVDLPAFYVHVEQDYTGVSVDHDCAIVFAENKAWLVDPAYEWFGVPHRSFHVLDDLQAIAHHASQPHNGKPDVSLCRVALKLDPDSAFGQAALIQALINASQFSAAREELDRFWQDHPGDWHACQLEGFLACKQDRLEDGIGWLFKAKEANPASGDTRLGLAEALFLRGQLKAAHEEFRTGLNRTHSRSVEEMARKRLKVLDQALGGSGAAHSPEGSKVDAESYWDLGNALMSRSNPDYSGAAKWFQKAAEMGNPRAAATLGVLYWNGLGVRRDLTESIRWSRKGADGGNAEAMRNLYIAYSRGLGSDKNPEEAMRWLRRAAEAGDGPARVLLGKALYEGSGTSKNLSEALFWLYLVGEEEVVDEVDTIGQPTIPQLHREARALVREVELFATPEEIAEARKRLERFRNTQ